MFNGCGFWPRFDSLDLVLVNVYAMCIYNVTQEVHFWLKEGTLRKFTIEFILL
jgi:hypothetical protein